MQMTTATLLPNKTHDQLLSDFVEFSRAQLASGDVDPVYDVLREVQRGIDRDRAIWGTLLHVAYYNLASGWLAWRAFLTPEHVASVCNDALLKLPTGIERRGLRVPERMRYHLDSLTRCWMLHDKRWARFFMRDFAVNDTYGDGVQEANWHALQDTIEGISFNGRWAAYKTGEMLLRVHDFPVRPTDMGNAFSSGPRHGLALFYPEVEGNSVEAIRRLDEQGDELLDKCWREGVYIDIAQLETMLCDFHSLVKGRYYIGHDIDQMYDQLRSAERVHNGIDFGALWQARSAAFTPNYLSEQGEALGVEPGRKTVYRDTGRLLYR